ncbi:MAG: type II secretion system protein GspD, partial [bacterium]
AQAEKLMAELNIPQKQVIIEVRIEEISRTDLKKIGVDPDQLSQINFIQGNNNNLTGVEITLPSFLKALREEGKSKTLASPRLMTLNGEQASLLIGDVLYVETGTGEDTAIETIEAGINLNFRPWVTAEEEIVLEVNPQVSSFDTRSDGGIASVNTREANTKVRLENGQMIAIGGLIQEKEIENISGIPILSEIPILGKIFKQHSTESNETELLILITPTIVEHNIVQDSIENDMSLGRKVPENFVLEKDLQQTISEAKEDQAQPGEENYPTTDELAVLLLMIGAIYGLVN